MNKTVEMKMNNGNELEMNNDDAVEMNTQNTTEMKAKNEPEMNNRNELEMNRRNEPEMNTHLKMNKTVEMNKRQTIKHIHNHPPKNTTVTIQEGIQTHTVLTRLHYPKLILSIKTTAYTKSQARKIAREIRGAIL